MQMRRAGVSLPPEAIWLGDSWEESPARRSAPDPVPARERRPVAIPEQRPVAIREREPEPRSAERRTVVIRGRGAERDLTWTAYQSRRRPTRPRHERPGFKPDRAALWAVVLGLLLVLVAATSSHAAVRTHFTHSSSPPGRPAAIAAPLRPRA
jgi:hypothetical protein